MGGGGSVTIKIVAKFFDLVVSLQGETAQGEGVQPPERLHGRKTCILGGKYRVVSSPEEIA